MTREFKTGKLQVKIATDRAAMGETAASEVIAKINALLANQPFVNIIFAAAPSQNEFLAALTKASLDWSRIRAFHMDEYIGLNETAPQRFGNFLKEKIFGKLPFAAIYYLNGNAAAPVEECKRYADLLLEYPVDIVCMGIGENGHIAFNDPPVADFNDPELVKIVELDRLCRQQQVNDGCFATLNEVPVNAVTLTIPALMTAPFI
jgi:glucosamine-6-phosphate deaminase